jgi:hypothetical protein
MSAPSYQSFLARLKAESPERPQLEEQRGGRGETPQGKASNITPGADGEHETLNSKLNTTTNKSLDKANAILDIPLDPDRPHYPAELRARTAIINTTLATQTKVDDTSMRRQTFDRLPELIEMVKEEAKRRPFHLLDGTIFQLDKDD